MLKVTRMWRNQASTLFQRESFHPHHEGTVSSRFDLPGAGTSVIVTHGGYRTVYTNLRDCPVQKGQSVDRGTFLGHVRGEADTNAILHFEVWKVAGAERTPVDPRKWLTAR